MERKEIVMMSQNQLRQLHVIGKVLDKQLKQSGSSRYFRFKQKANKEVNGRRLVKEGSTGSGERERLVLAK